MMPVSPAKIMQTSVFDQKNSLSTFYKGSSCPLTQKWQYVLQNLESFWKDRMYKLKECLQQVRDSATDDDIVKTMLSN